MRKEEKKIIQHDDEKRRVISDKHRKRIQIISLVVIAMLLVGITLLLMPLISSWRTNQGKEEIIEKLRSYSGVTGVLIFTLIQALQVVIAVVPPIQVVGGLLFGWFFGAVLSFVGVILGSLVIFFVVKKLGTPLVEAVVNEKNLKKFKFLNDERKLTGVLMVLYLIPGIPKDVLTYMVPLTKISAKDFFMYVMPCRLPAIIMSTLIGSNVGSGNFKIVIVILALLIAIGIFGLFFKDLIIEKFNKRKNERKSGHKKTN